MHRPSSFLINLERALRFEYSEVLRLEEEFWSMKLQISWVVDGDRNTTFFHTSTLVCKRRNMITCMKDRIGNWHNGDFAIANFIRHGLFDLFSSSQSNVPIEDWIPPFWQCRLGNEDRGKLQAPVIDSEIFYALKTLKPYKTPGPNGLHAGFFQRFWLIVGNSVKAKVKSIFSFGVVLEY